MHKRLRSIAEWAGARDAEALAGQLIVLYNGAQATAALFGSAEPANQVSEMAHVLIDAQCSPALESR